MTSKVLNRESEMFRERFAGRERPFRGHRQESYFQKGDLKYIILDLIRNKPRHGYEIIRELEEASHGLYKPSPGVVYPTLQMLEDMEYVTVAERDGKKVYTITDLGERFLVEQKDLADGARNQMKRKWGFKKIGGMVMLMKEYHALEDLVSRGLRSLDEDKTQKIRQVLIQTVKSIEEILEN